jgi:pimeloyl-ACP methyl ester carboxylesterase
MSATTALSPAIARLTERYDPDVIDIPGGRARIRLAETDGEAWDALLAGDILELGPADPEAGPEAVLTADRASWQRVARDVRGGMVAFRQGRLTVRRNLHLGVGFLAATSGMAGPDRLRFESVATQLGTISTMQAGSGEPVLCLHGLGATKASFLPTIAALADRHRVIAVDLLGFGESDKPVAAPYDARWFARSAVALLDALGIERAHLVGNSMGGRVAIEAGLRAPQRSGRIVLLSPALAWLRDRRWAGVVKVLRPELGLLQLAPRGLTEGVVRRVVPGATNGWAAAGVDEFLRSYLTPRGRAAFYAAARSIYLDKPHGEDGFWPRLAGLSPETLFVWGKRDRLVPVSFRKYVQRALPAARHVELDCGHVPQLEAPSATHAAIARFLALG